MVELENDDILVIRHQSATLTLVSEAAHHLELFLGALLRPQRETPLLPRGLQCHFPFDAGKLVKVVDQPRRQIVF